MATREKYLDKLLWLASRDVLFFGTWDTETQQHVEGWRSYVLCSDSFSYGADAEQVDETSVDLVTEMFDEFGMSGVLAWVSWKRGQEALKDVQTDVFTMALEELHERR
jgi:hypothetical protein